MKFLIFNFFVIAAIGFLLHERGALDGSPAGEVAAKAVSVAEQKLKPAIENLSAMSEQSNSQDTQTNTETMTATTIPVADTTSGEPNLTSPSAVKSVAVREPVEPAVAARRDIVLGVHADNNSDVATPSPDRVERRQRLLALAEEAEMLSIELIYR